MTLTVETAAQAGQLAAAIQARLGKLAQIEDAISGGWLISKFAATGPAENEVSLILDRLDEKSSAAALQYAKSIYGAQLEALNAQLAAIS